MIYACCDRRRLQAVEEGGVLNGIGYVEVSDSEAPTHALRQRTLFVRLLKPPPGGAQKLTPDNVSITGGERIPTVGVEWVAPATALPAGEDPDLVAGLDDPATVLLVRSESRGDFSTYTLALVASPTDASAPAGFDRMLVSVDFSFKVECLTDFDCRVDDPCGPEQATGPTIDYLAKDYSTFRRLMLDRLSLTTPGWNERNPADLGVALVEVLAYMADELSYRQDAVSTEAYLATARRRPSLRRLARLVDYAVHEGSNARVWVRMIVGGENVTVPADLQLLTKVEGLDPVLEPDGAALTEALGSDAEVFELVPEVAAPLLHQSLEALDFYSWGDMGCCLPQGAAAATLHGHHANKLVPGQVLVLAEVASSTTGNPADADPSRRAAVRLTSVKDSEDESGGRFKTPPDNTAVKVTEIEWHSDDALPFPVCVSDQHHPGLAVSQAWGNILLADHGRTVTEEDFATVPASVLTYALASPQDRCEETADRPVPVRFRPTLANAPLTHVLASPLAVAAKDPTGSLPSARATLVVDPRRARPAVRLASELDTVTQPWTPLSDLLMADGDDANFVVEAEHDGTARLRFGDNTHGRRPEEGSVFTATCRVGNGVAGNIGLEAIAHVATTTTSITGATNPLPAVGGVDPESAEVVRRDAPEAFLVQERAVTASDYAEVTERDPEVQRAAATFRWTGSWHTVFVTADRAGGGAIDQTFEAHLRDHIEPYRMAGYDLEVDAPHFVPLHVALHICAQREFFRSQVRGAVLDVLSSGVRRDGSLGLFHPDRFTFAQPVYLSAIVAEAQAVAGVESVSVVTFQRQRDDASSGIDKGVLPMGRLEIARLDNNPNFPERGLLVVNVGGGK